MKDSQSSIQSPKSLSPSNGEIGGNVDLVEARFFDFAKNRLDLDSFAFDGAFRLFKETKHLLQTNVSVIGSGTPEEAERFWFAFVVYSAKKLGLKEEEKVVQRSEDDGSSLCKILRASNLTILGFFEELPLFLFRAGSVLSSLYGSDWENKLEAKELQASFDVLNALSEFYKRAYLKLFVASDTVMDEKSTVENPTGYLSDYHRFGWLLFLAFRTHVLSHWQDLVTCSTCLISTLAVLIIHVPVRFRNFSINDFPNLVKKEDKTVDLLASLCKIYDCSEDDLKKRVEEANSLISKILKKKPRLASECQSEKFKNINLDGLTYFEDLMDSSFPSSLVTLECDYTDAIRNKCVLDERVFMNKGDSLLKTESLSGGSIDITGVKRKFDAMSSPTRKVVSPLSPRCTPSSPVNLVVDGPNAAITATPVSTAMATAKWLQTVISPLPPKPSPELERFFVSCDKDVSNDVIRRGQIILEAIFPNSSVGDRCVTGSLQRANLAWPETRRLEALKLYYRVLEAMCRAEAQILRSSNLTSLLTNERFHRCMLACSAELVLAALKSVTMLFPAVLERTGITAFDLSKVIESFVRHEETLPRELRRHLNSLEERLLESMVWEKGSSMYNSLTVARPALSVEINRLGLLAEPMPSLDEIALHINFSNENSPGNNGDMKSPKRVCAGYRSILVERNTFPSPVKNNLKRKLPLPLQSAFASPTRPNPGGGGETCAETGINVFFSKISKLAAVRINGLVERLQLSQQIRETVYRLFQQLLCQKTDLFFNRHIDQIILSSIYGVAKISQLSLTFKEITHNYSKQPQCKPHVYTNVFVGSSTPSSKKSARDYAYIITFYNQVFLPVAKPLLVEELGHCSSSTKTERSPESNINNDAQCPRSPKVSSFPSLPDMSPKKVSASQNVYVSPMRSSKMDAMISHSSKSYYACVGESTHAYQSPSKDLSAINTRLNDHSPQKFRGSLNFDNAEVSLVSDSMVANSLFFQKTEKQDS